MQSNLWINGPIELIKHDISHIEEGNDFDLRIAMISIDNAVELAIKTYLALNRRSLNLEREEYKKVIQNFPRLLDALQDRAHDKVSDEELDAIEQFHSLRNSLYHQENGITVEANMVNSYSLITKDLISRLFSINIENLFEVGDELSQLLGDFLINWREFETNLRNYAIVLNIPKEKSHRMHEYKNILLKNELINRNDVEKLNHSRDFRNKLVHGVIQPSSDELKQEIELIKDLNKKFEDFFKEKPMF